MAIRRCCVGGHPSYKQEMHRIIQTDCILEMLGHTVHVYPVMESSIKSRPNMTISYGMELRIIINVFSVDFGLEL